MTCVDEENKIYCVELDAEIDYEKIIFNNGGSSNQTGDLLIEGYEMLYDFGTSKWEDYTQTEQGTVNVKYVDENGTVLVSTSISGDVGAKYTTSAKTIDGYTLKTTPANASGTYTSGTITVTYVYSKNTGGTTGWQKVDGKWYYYDATGSKLTGWHKLDGNWYYMDASGAMLTGWQKLDGKWYYMNNQGVMQKGWLKLGNTWYYMNNQGAMQTGWKYVDNKWYYMNASGAMQSSKWIGNYYLKADGSMAVSEWVDGGKYYVDKNGVWVPNP